MTNKWEYLEEEISLFYGFDTKKLANLGKKGWELICIDGCIAYFKRPIEDKEKTDDE